MVNKMSLLYIIFPRKLEILERRQLKVKLTIYIFLYIYGTSITYYSLCLNVHFIVTNDYSIEGPTRWIELVKGMTSQRSGSFSSGT